MRSVVNGSQRVLFVVGSLEIVSYLQAAAFQGIRCSLAREKGCTAEGGITIIVHLVEGHGRECQK